MDKIQDILLGALRQAAADPEAEHRLYGGGKLDGLFATKNSLQAEIASQALTDGLLEMVRTESKGKTTIEWVKVTPKGIEHLLEQESPLRVLQELQGLLQANQEGLPAWMADLQTRVADLSRQVEESLTAMRDRIDFLAQRVAEALKRADRMGPVLPEGSATALPWSHEAVSYLEKRQAGGLGERCPLPELFAILRPKEEDLTIVDFHSGLRRLHDRGVLRLLPFEEEGGPPEPEYALLDGANILYYAAR